MSRLVSSPLDHVQNLQPVSPALQQRFEGMAKRAGQAAQAQQRANAQRAQAVRHKFIG